MDTVWGPYVHFQVNMNVLWLIKMQSAMLTLQEDLGSLPALNEAAGLFGF